MKRLFLLTLPVLLAGCPTPKEAGDASPAPVAAPAPATPTTPTTPDAPVEAADAATPADPATAGDAAPKVVFRNAGMVAVTGTLPKYQWRLVEARDGKGSSIDALLVRPAQPVTLDFKAGKLAVGNTCNRMGGRYAIGNRMLTIDQLAATKRACADPKLMALDQEIGRRLEGKLGLRMATGDERQLELKNAAGDVLVFAGKRTAPLRATTGKPAAAQDDKQTGS